MNEERQSKSPIGRKQGFLALLFGIGLLQLFLYVQLLAMRNFAADIVGYLTLFFEIFVAYMAASILSLKISGDLRKSTSRHITAFVLVF